VLREVGLTTGQKNMKNMEGFCRRKCLKVQTCFESLKKRYLIKLKPFKEFRDSSHRFDEPRAYVGKVYLERYCEQQLGP
jgi:hypothetical protein